jgi:hypothetical protein
VGYSVLGMLVSMLVLVKFKPTILPRMVVALLLGFVLVYCLTYPLNGDPERIKDVHSIGWLALGLLFGIGRGEFVIEYLTRRFFGAPDQLVERMEKSEAQGQSGSDGQSTGDGHSEHDGNSEQDGNVGAAAKETSPPAIDAAARPQPEVVINTGSIPKTVAESGKEKSEDQSESK